MEKFIPYEKLSKKEKRKLNQAKRQTWNSLNPVTRKPINSKAYNRRKARNWTRDCERTSSGFVSFLFRSGKIPFSAKEQPPDLLQQSVPPVL